MAIDRSEPVNLDAIIVGAGVGGLYAIYRLRKLGLKLRAFEGIRGVDRLPVAIMQNRALAT